MIGDNYNIQWNIKQQEVENFFNSKIIARPNTYSSYEDYENELKKFKKILSTYDKEYIDIGIDKKINGLIIYPDLSRPSKCHRTYIDIENPFKVGSRISDKVGIIRIMTLNTRDMIIGNEYYEENLYLSYNLNKNEIYTSIYADMKL